MSKISSTHLTNILNSNAKDTRLTADRDQTKVEVKTGGRVISWFKSFGKNEGEANKNGRRLLADNLFKELRGHNLYNGDVVK